MTSFVDGLPNDIRESLTISVDQLQALSVQFQEEIDRGLTGDRSSLKMLQTFAQQPRGDERGRVIVVDWGGTHGRVVMVDLQGSGKYAVLHQKDFKFTDAQKTSSTEIVFGIIAETIKQVIGKDRQRSYSLGFIYSFPARLEKINKAIALPMTKGWHLTGLQGKDVVELLTLALQKQGLTNVTVSAVANDTVAPMVLHTYCTKGQHPTAKPTEIGLILGTGTNQAVDLPSLGIYNMESGNFSGVISVHTRYDRQLDQELRDPPPGAQLFEKMVSGQYLGELVRRILYELVRQKVLSWPVVEVLQTPFAFETSSLSRIAKDTSPTLRDIELLLQEFGIQSTLTERRLVKEIAHTIVRRSARLVAASVAGTLRKIDPSWAEEHTIAVDGSLYGRYPGYNQMVQTTLAEIIGVDRAKRVQWVFVHNSTSAGAAVIAAVASREGFSE